MASISVLIVDDDLVFRRAARHFLEVCHHQEVTIVGTAGGGEEGLAQVQGLQPDVILIDLVMPGMSGLEAIPLLREALPQAGIIALSLMRTGGYRQAALEVGADDFVPKITMTTELLPAIRRVVRARRAKLPVSKR